MKKNTVIILVAICLIIAGLATLTAAFVMADFSFEGFSSERFEEVTYTVYGNFEHILIATDIHDVAIALSSDNSCRIVGSESKNIKIEYELEDNTLVIKTTDERKWYDHIGIFVDEAALTLYLPKDIYTSFTAAANTGDILLPHGFTFTGAAVATSTGDIRVYSKITGELGLAASTGSIIVRDIEPTKLDVSVSTGTIMLDNIKTDGEITLESSTGGTELHSVEAGGITSHGTTGDLLLKNVYVQNDINIKRNTGDVTLTSVIAGSLGIETSTGDVKLNSSDAESIEIETDTGKVEGTLLTDKVFITESSTGSIKIPHTNSGGTCKIRTSTGDIKITIE